MLLPQQLFSLLTWLLLRSKIYPTSKYSSTTIDATLQDQLIIIPNVYSR